MIDSENRQLEKVSKEIKNAIYGGCVMAVVNSLFGPVISFVLGWVGGSILNWCVGGWVVSALNTLFDTTRFSQSMVPALFAVLTMFLGYLKVYQYNTSDSNKSSSTN
jgi:hypothetical protein